MIKVVKNILFVSLLLSAISSYAQEEPGKLELNGYLSNLQSVMVTGSYRSDWISDNLFHNRLNFSWYPAESIKFSLQMRNRLMYGETVKLSPDFGKAWDSDMGFCDLSFNLFNERSFILNSAIDRLNFQYTYKKLTLTAGRQRINWGQTFVWNPNDIFNIQNFFDWDYSEKQGSDAIRMQYHTGIASVIEFAAKIDADKNLTAAGLLRFNKWKYDFQIIGGLFEQTDLMAGMGWAGNIRKSGFRGEFTYFHPIGTTNDSNSLFIVSLSGDHTFSNAVFLQGEVLYSPLPEDFNPEGFAEYFTGHLHVKKLSFSEWTLFLQVSYPASPLVNLSFSGMYLPDLKGFYAGPTLGLSLTDNMQLSIVTQNFNGEFISTGSLQKERKNLFLGFLRIKWNF